LAIADSFLTGWPASSRAAASYQASRAACTRTSMSATVNWIAWCWPMGRPNASRWPAYLTHSSTQPCASPVASAAIATRPSVRIRRNWA